MNLRLFFKFALTLTFCLTSLSVSADEKGERANAMEVYFPCSSANVDLSELLLQNKKEVDAPKIHEPIHYEQLLLNQNWGAPLIQNKIKIASPHADEVLKWLKLDQNGELFKQIKLDQIKADQNAPQNARVVEMVQKLITILKDGNREAQQDAKWKLLNMGPAAKAAIPALIASFKTERMNAQGRLMSVDALVRMGAEAVPGLIEALKDESSQFRELAVHTLGELRLEAKAAIPTLIQTLKEDKNAIVREAAIIALEKIGVLEFGDSEAKQRAARILAQMGLEAKAAIPALIQALNDERTQGAAAEALGNLGLEAKAAIPALNQALNDDNARVRWTTIIALGKIVGDAELLIPLLKKALKDEEASVRKAAVEYLVVLGEEPKAEDLLIGQVLKDANVSTEIAELIKTLSEDYSSVQNKDIAEAKLVKMGSKAVPALVAVLKSGDLEAAQNAASILGQMGVEAKAAIPVLITVLNHEDWDVGEAAAVALGRMGAEAKAAIPVLITALKAEDLYLREAAARALGEIGVQTKVVVPALIVALKDEYANVPVSAAVALGRMGAEAKAAIPALITALNAEDLYLREAAANTLANIKPDLLVSAYLSSRSENRDLTPLLLLSGADLSQKSRQHLFEKFLERRVEMFSNERLRFDDKFIELLSEVKDPLKVEVDALAKMTKDANSSIGIIYKTIDRWGHKAAPALPAILVRGKEFDERHEEQRKIIRKKLAELNGVEGLSSLVLGKNYGEAITVLQYLETFYQENPNSRKSIREKLPEYYDRALERVINDGLGGVKFAMSLRTLIKTIKSDDTWDSKETRILENDRFQKELKEIPKSFLNEIKELQRTKPGQADLMVMDKALEKLNKYFLAREGLLR